MIRTLAEIRAENVTVTVTVDSAPSDSVADLSAAELAAEVTRLETELERYRRTHVCTDRCQPQAHVAMVGRRLVAELERTLAESRELVKFKETVADEIDREADRLRGKVRELMEGREADHQEIMALRQAVKDRDNRMAEQETEHRQSMDARERLLSEAVRDREALSTQLSKVNGAVHGPGIVAALRQVARSPEQSETLANAVRNTRRAIGSPGVGTDPA